jgi:methionyl-tRNA synthetase
VPESAEKILDQLGIAAEARNFSAFSTPLTPGTPLAKPEGVFPRVLEG